MGDVVSRSAETIRDEMLDELLPPGMAWPKDPSSNLGGLFQALAVSRAQIEADIEGLRQEISPGTSVKLLADYEDILGRACCGTNSDTLTFAQRQAVAQARWVGRKITTAQDFIDLASAMGFSVTIEEF